MLALRPTCEHCNKLLPANATEAMICSFECTFCAECVTHVLENVCPNCGGGFVARPIRPEQNLVNGAFLENHPASEKVVHKPLDVKAHQIFARHIKNIPPHQR